MSDESQTPRPGKEKLAKPEAKNKPIDKDISDLMSETIGPLWEKLNIDTAVVIARIPNSDQVSIYYRGHFYDVATLLSKMNNKFTAQIDRELGRGGR